MEKMQPVILDTNFWLLPYEHGVDILRGLENLFEYKPFLVLAPQPVLGELGMMAGGRGKKALWAKSALSFVEGLAKKGKAQIVEAGGKADGAIITLAIQKGAWVATNDRPLRFRLKERGIKTVILKDKHAIALA